MPWEERMEAAHERRMVDGEVCRVCHGVQGKQMEPGALSSRGLALEAFV